MSITSRGRVLTLNTIPILIGAAANLGTSTGTVFLTFSVGSDLAEVVEWGLTMATVGTGTGTYDVTLGIRESDTNAQPVVGSIITGIDPTIGNSASYKAPGVLGTRVRQGSRFVLNVTVNGSITGTANMLPWALGRL